MKLIRLTVFFSLCLAQFAVFSSCEKEAEKKKVNVYAKPDIAMTGAQIAPVPSPSGGTGTLSVSYDKRTKVLNYTISWSGLSDSVIAIRINGPAPVGFSALNLGFTGASPTAFTTTPYNVIQQFTGTGSKALYPATGSFSGSLATDDVKVIEQDLLNQTYYVTIHTKTFTTAPPYSAPASFLYRWFGEIRGQIVFQ